MKAKKRPDTNLFRMKKQILNMLRIDLNYKRKLEKQIRNRKDKILNQNKINNCFYKLTLLILVYNILYLTP